jgi:hypothetical protein
VTTQVGFLLALIGSTASNSRYVPATKATPTSAAAARSVVWSATLAGPTRADLGKALDTPFEDGWHVHDTKTGQQRTAATCRQLLALSKDFEPDDPGQSEWNLYVMGRVRCRTIATLQKATPARADYLGAFTLDNARLKEIPAVVIPTASPEHARRIEKASAKGASWKTWDTGIHVSKATASKVLVESKTTRCFLAVLGRGDLNGDGVEDLVLWRSGGGQRGTWATTDAFVLTRRTRGGRLEIIETIN